MSNNSLNAALLLIAMFTVAGVAVESHAQTAKDHLVGNWEANLEVDTAKMTAQFKAQGIEEAQATALIERFRTQLGEAKLKLVLQANGDFQVDMLGGAAAGDQHKGTWKVISEEGDTAKIQTVESSGKKVTMEVKFLSKNAFEMRNPEMADAPIQIPVFKRVVE